MNEEFPFELRRPATCDLGELADAILSSSKAAADFAYYMAALLLGRKSEVPVPGERGHFFAAITVLETQDDKAFCAKATKFFQFRNLASFAGRLSLQNLVEQRGSAVDDYAIDLKARCAKDSDLSQRLADHDKDARNLASTQPALRLP